MTSFMAAPFAVLDAHNPRPGRVEARIPFEFRAWPMHRKAEEPDPLLMAAFWLTSKKAKSVAHRAQSPEGHAARPRMVWLSGEGRMERKKQAWYDRPLLGPNDERHFTDSFRRREVAFRTGWSAIFRPHARSIHA